MKITVLDLELDFTLTDKESEYLKASLKYCSPNGNYVNFEVPVGLDKIEVADLLDTLDSMLNGILDKRSIYSNYPKLNKNKFEELDEESSDKVLNILNAYNSLVSSGIVCNE